MNNWLLIVVSLFLFVPIIMLETEKVDSSKETSFSVVYESGQLIHKNFNAEIDKDLWANYSDFNSDKDLSLRIRVRTARIFLHPQRNILCKKTILQNKRLFLAVALKRTLLINYISDSDMLINKKLNIHEYNQLII